MSHQGSGSALLIASIVLMMAVTLVPLSDAAVYTVGDARGWTFGTVNWPQAKHFQAGDSLVFNYSPAFHNVVAVNRAAYDGCFTPPGAKVYRTGNDHITLVKGQNYFLCGIPGHCQSGMKIAVYAA